MKVEGLKKSKKNIWNVELELDRKKIFIKNKNKFEQIYVFFSAPQSHKSDLPRV